MNTAAPARRRISRALAALAVCAIALPALAQITIPIPNPANLGTDGAFNPTQSVTIPLATAVTGSWDQAGNGNGVYDAEKWAVVYKYSSVNIPAGVTVRFANHPSGAPVVWLVSGDVTISGSVSVSGQFVSSLSGSTFPIGGVPGPGGFAGGDFTGFASAGRGPGGGPVNLAQGQGAGGSYGSTGLLQGQVSGGKVYGTTDLVPLIGGSGGGSPANQPGAGGGGAILIVSTGVMTINGGIYADGGYSNTAGGAGGSGGGIRLVANTLSGGGTLSAMGNNGYYGSLGGFGRIRTEANIDSFASDGGPARSRATVGSTARLWPDSTQPKITAVSIGSKPVPPDPRGLITFATTDVELSDNPIFPAPVTIYCQNVPLTSTVEIRLVPITQGKVEQRATASYVSGDQTASIWTVNLPLTTSNGGGVVSFDGGTYTFTVSVTLP